MTDAERFADIMKQGCMKRLPAPKGTVATRRIREIKAALAGKRGHQSAWAIESLREELAAIRA